MINIKVFLKSKLELLKNNETKIIVFTFITFTIIFLGHLIQSGKTTEVSTKSEEKSIDTYIPSGQVLVPIEIVNVEPLSSLIGQTAIVDLYSMNKDGSKGRKVGRRLKLLRAPLNPNTFAVLVSEVESSRIMEESGPFYVLVQNRRDESGEFSNTKAKVPKIEILYQNEKSI